MLGLEGTLPALVTFSVVVAPPANLRFPFSYVDSKFVSFLVEYQASTTFSQFHDVPSQ